MKRHSIVNRLMSRFTYSEKFIFITLMFALSMLILSGLMIYEQEQDIKAVDYELAGSDFARPLRKLMEHVPIHKILNSRFLKGNTAVKSELISIQSQINEDLKNLHAINTQLANLLRTNESNLRSQGQSNITPEEIERKWDNIKIQAFEVSPEINVQLHTELIESIRGLFSYIQDTSGLVTDPVINSRYLVNTILMRLPDFQDILTQILTLGQNAIEKNEISTEDQLKIVSLAGVLKSHLNWIQRGLEKTFIHTEHTPQAVELKQFVEPVLNSFISSTEDFLNLVNDIAIKKDITEQEFLASGEKTFNASFKLWDNTLEQLSFLLQERKKNLRIKEFFGLSLSFLFGLIGFIVGLFIMRQISQSLNNLTETTRQLSNGDLSARVHIEYQDEIGKVGMAFNTMAQSFQTIIGQLRELLEAIKRLANGDFSARLQVTNPDDEIGLVGQSFNNMANSFEEIISQLHQLGINLTTSATEIAAASKQQETIIMEQEATTREISVTANEISTTAKEFANTVSEVSKVAEHTSSLAAGGKESLTHMEAIMRQMVEASTGIGSKLAVLNEKAGNITTVITTITKVADQTNLLSLNTAIEAEKAGEFGRSFAVIAREIRRLADQTAFATLDIEKIVNEIMSAVSTSVMGVDDFSQEIRVGVEQVSKVGEQLSKIIEQVQALTYRFDSVNQGMQAQSAGAEQINEAIAQLSQTAQQTTESIHQFRNTIQQLNTAATDLRIAVSKIKKS